MKRITWRKFNALRLMMLMTYMAIANFTVAIEEDDALNAGAPAHPNPLAKTQDVTMQEITLMGMEIRRRQKREAVTNLSVMAA